jgi:LEA14-like dessication related protein
MKRFIGLMILAVMAGCVPKKDVEFRRVENVQFEAAAKSPMLRADVVLYNPNNTKGKLKKIELDILVNDKKVGTIDQVLDQSIHGMAEFTVPVHVSVDMKELGLLDTLVSLFGGKKYVIRIVGKVKGKVQGFGITVNVDHKEEIKLKL